MLGRDLALAIAHNYRKLRKAGTTVRKTIDVIIATFCEQKRYRLLQSDREFTLMQSPLGLRVI